MDFKRESGECHTARAVLRQVAKRNLEVERWLVEIVSKHPYLLEEGVVNRETFQEMAKASGHAFPISESDQRPRPLPAPRPPKRRPPETVLEPKCVQRMPRVNLIDLALVAKKAHERIPKRFRMIAEPFARDFGLSEFDLLDMMRALRRQFPGESPSLRTIRHFYWNFLAGPLQPPGASS